MIYLTFLSKGEVIYAGKSSYRPIVGETFSFDDGHVRWRVTEVHRTLTETGDAQRMFVHVVRVFTVPEKA